MLLTNSLYIYGQSNRITYYGDYVEKDDSGMWHDLQGNYFSDDEVMPNDSQTSGVLATGLEEITTEDIAFKAVCTFYG